MHPCNSVHSYAGSCPRAGYHIRLEFGAPAQHRLPSSATELPAGGWRRKLFTCSIPATLLIQNGILTPGGPSEDEFGRPCQTRQDGSCRIEQRPVADFTVGPGYDHGPLRPGYGADADQAPAFGELAE